MESRIRENEQSKFAKNSKAMSGKVFFLFLDGNFILGWEVWSGVDFWGFSGKSQSRVFRLFYIGQKYLENDFYFLEIKIFEVIFDFGIK